MVARVEIRGLQKAIKKVARDEKEAQEMEHEIISELTLATHAEAVRGLQRGPKTGRIYRKTRPVRVHQASAVGEYPASDTGRLANGTKFSLPAKNRRVKIGQVYTNVRYGKHLELKPVQLGGRPWLSRAAKVVTRRHLQEIIDRAVGRFN